MPENPVLAQVASALNRAGAWGHIYDREHRLVYLTDELRLTLGGLVEMVPVPRGAYFFGTEYVTAILGWPSGGWNLDSARGIFSAWGPWALADAPGGREELRELVDPAGRQAEQDDLDADQVRARRDRQGQRVRRVPARP